MSRIFDALQRSGTEQSGVEYPDMVSVAAAVFEAPREQTPAEPLVVEEPLPDVLLAPGKNPFTAVSPASPADNGDSYPAFPSLEVAIAPASRLVFFTQPESLAAEKFRFLGVRLRQMRQTRPLKKVLVTSTIPEEGKSLVSVNLAGVLARRKHKVLLIEGDLRRPTVAQQLGLGRLAGLAEWLQGGLETASNIYHLRGPGFWILPAGDPPASPLELMQSARLSSLVAQLTTLFDWIVVDSPPLLPLADTTVWSRLTDGTLLVTREGTTEKKPLQRGLEMIKKSDLLGVVLNGCSNTDHDSYYQRYSPPGTK
ncbi:MAG TPA: CpsD/CapB family tyrosine-protein kinase [Candidatus Dormibacteraeota bacterium]|nr:CpsD/CapB family tyrosine-protein kinase [Candidatus Dormibacteraeota bacterium]